MLEIKDLHFSYSKRGQEILSGVDMSLEAGKTGIVLGKNGAGKSTLFSVILGINKAASGSITLDGVRLDKISPCERARMTAYVPQNISFGALTVFDTVLSGRVAYFGLRASKEDAVITKKIIDDMGLSSLSDRYADTLSGGEKQKVAIARAIAQAPKLMVFDEPTGNLDITNEQILLSQIDYLTHEKNIAVLIALHDMNTALNIGDSFYFMKAGRIFASGGSEIVTGENINNAFDANVRIVEIENRKIILTGGN